MKKTGENSLLRMNLITKKQYTNTQIKIANLFKTELVKILIQRIEKYEQTYRHFDT